MNAVAALRFGSTSCACTLAHMARADGLGDCPTLREYLARIRARPAYQRGEAKGGPVIMAT